MALNDFYFLPPVFLPRNAAHFATRPLVKCIVITPAALPICPGLILQLNCFSFRRGRNFGTIVVDLEDHKVIDLLPDIKKETVSEWLKEHPEIEIISRDRASAFTEAGRMAAPQAVQIADRFHVSQNLWEVCEALIKYNYPSIRQILANQSREAGPATPGLSGDELTVGVDSPPNFIEKPAPAESQQIVRERPQKSSG